MQDGVSRFPQLFIWDKLIINLISVWGKYWKRSHSVRKLIDVLFSHFLPYSYGLVLSPLTRITNCSANYHIFVDSCSPPISIQTHSGGFTIFMRTGHWRNKLMQLIYAPAAPKPNPNLNLSHEKQTFDHFFLLIFLFPKALKLLWWPPDCEDHPKSSSRG